MGRVIRLGPKISVGTAGWCCGRARHRGPAQFLSRSCLTGYTGIASRCSSAVAAVVGGRRPSIVAAVCAALAFNVLFIPPTLTLKIKFLDDVVAFLVFVTVAGSDRNTRRPAVGPSVDGGAARD